MDLPVLARGMHGRMPISACRTHVLPTDTSTQALIPLSGCAGYADSKCLTEQRTYSKHCLIHVLKSHLQAYFHSSDINHCKYVLINKEIQTDCLSHPYHMQVSGQHTEEGLFPAHLGPPLAAASTGTLGTNNRKSIPRDTSSPEGLVAQDKAAESSLHCCHGVVWSHCTQCPQTHIGAEMEMPQPGQGCPSARRFSMHGYP